MPPNIPEIDIQAAKDHHTAGTATFIDVRDPGAYQASHIPGALHVTDANIQEFVNDADKTQTVIVNCYMGNSSLGATQYLLEQGFSEVFSMKGGFEAWRAVYEFEAAAAPPAPKITPPPVPAPPVREPAPPEKKTSFFGRLFGRKS